VAKPVRSTFQPSEFVEQRPCVPPRRLAGTDEDYRSFVFQTRIEGRVRRVTLGAYPAMSVAQARQKALEMKTAVGRGDDPAEAKKKERQEATFGDICDAYLKGAELRGLRTL
jgi:hypothetical protein